MKNCLSDMTQAVNIRKSPYDVYIGRPSKWGNPFSHRSKETTLAKHNTASRDESIAKYREWICRGDGRELLFSLHELKGKRLGCFCHPQQCHGDVLSWLAETVLDGEGNFKRDFTGIFDDELQPIFVGDELIDCDGNIYTVLIGTDYVPYLGTSGGDRIEIEVKIKLIKI